jgi:(R,R)-butanediol dehydrogenase / meso-butanediol dehydrogenase / diacetyl reductase
VVVISAMNCIPLPQGVSLKAGALAEPLAIAQHCINTAGFQVGQTALVCGAGLVGLALIVMLRQMGAAAVIVTEVTESRLAQAKRFGATTVINPLEKVEGHTASSPDPVMAAIHQTAADGVDVAFDATGLQSTLDLCFDVTKGSGIIFNAAIHEKPLLVDLNKLVAREKKLMAGICYANKDFETVLDMMAKGDIDVEEMITAIVPLSEVVKGGFDELINNKAAHIKILVRPEQSAGS